MIKNKVETARHVDSLSYKLRQHDVSTISTYLIERIPK